MLARLPLARLTLLLLLVAPAAPAQDFRPKPFDWSQWQGPRRDNISNETDLLQEWPEEGPKLLWQVDNLGEGYSTPSVAAGRIFVMGNADGEEFVFCLREGGDKELWRTPLGPAVPARSLGGYGGPRCTPTVDGNRVYVLGADGALACLDVADGQIVWRKNLKQDFGGQRGGWGYTESPLIDGDRLVVTPGGKKATLVALNKANGDLIWQCAIPASYQAGYTSPIKADVEGVPQYIKFIGRGQGAEAARGAVLGVRAADGQLLWDFTDPDEGPGNGTANITTPVYADNHVFAASAYSTGGTLIKLERVGDRFTATKAYFTRDMQNHHGGMILLGGYLYGNNGGNLTCLEFKTGKVAWQSNARGKGKKSSKAGGPAAKGSITCADGRLYYRNERDGAVYLIEANPKEYVQLGRFPQPDRSDRNAWAHPIVANGRLYIADQNMLFCYDVKGK